MLKLICNFFILRTYAFVRPTFPPPSLVPKHTLLLNPRPAPPTLPPLCVHTEWMTSFCELLAFDIYLIVNEVLKLIFLALESSQLAIISPSLTVRRLSLVCNLHLLQLPRLQGLTLLLTKRRL